MAQHEHDLSIIESVLHPTDFSEGSRIAFYHALKAALIAKSQITLLNVSSDGQSNWGAFPGVRETLERWKLLPRGSDRSAVGELGVDARKVVAQESDPVDAVLKYLKNHPADFIVLATTHREGRSRWLGKSVAEPVARKAWQMTLFIPSGSDGFVSADDGSVHLTNIVIPVAEIPHPQPALDAAARLVEQMECPSGTFTLLHVGDESSLPGFNLPTVSGWEWKEELRDGDVIETIVNSVEEFDADLIVMTTDGRNGFLDGLRGSHSERVLRHGVVPLLTVPVGSLAANQLD